MAKKARKSPVSVVPDAQEISVIDELKTEQQNYAIAFHLIGNSSFPATQADAVLKALKFLDDRHSQVTSKIQAMTPPPVEATPEAAPEQTNG